ncbi:Hypothetical protein FKW44_006967, partial [Caligus rogercresseyi]
GLEVRKSSVLLCCEYEREVIVGKNRSFARIQAAYSVLNELDSTQEELDSFDEE